VAQEDIAAQMIDALDGASNLQLYQLKTLIEGMLADPKRTMKACASLHLGQAVRFVDFRNGQLRQGKVIAKHSTQATVFEESVRLPRQSRPARRVPWASHSAIGSASTTAKGIRSSAWWRRSTGVQRRSRPTRESPGASTFLCYDSWSKSDSSRQQAAGRRIRGGPQSAKCCRSRETALPPSNRGSEQASGLQAAVGYRCIAVGGHAAWGCNPNRPIGRGATRLQVSGTARTSRAPLTGLRQIAVVHEARQRGVGSGGTWRSAVRAGELTLSFRFVRHLPARRDDAAMWRRGVQTGTCVARRPFRILLCTPKHVETPTSSNVNVEDSGTDESGAAVSKNSPELDA
jgi:hypothetical protein